MLPDFQCGFQHVAGFFSERVISLGTSITVPAEIVLLVQFFESRTLLLSLDRPFKVKGKGVSVHVCMREAA